MLNNARTTRKVLFVMLLVTGSLLSVAQTTQAETRYFKVAEFGKSVTHGDSFILPLTDPTAISHAQDLITLGPDVAGSTIVVAKIAAGSDGINRDLNQLGVPLWSWHVTEFQNFADFTVEILDGWPTFVESDVQGWIDNTNSTIGFWSYTIVADVTADIPEPSTMMLLGLGTVGLARRRR